nr:MAG TPA: hypothetical protein [Caudoviricetes sp.]
MSRHSYHHLLFRYKKSALLALYLGYRHFTIIHK